MKACTAHCIETSVYKYDDTSDVTIAHHARRAESGQGRDYLQLDHTIGSAI